MLKGLLELMLLVVILGALLGFAFSRVEGLNPSVTAEQVRRMSAETAALEARNAYERQQQQLALERQQALAEKELAWRERWAETAEVAGSLIVIALAGAIVAAGLGGGAYLVCLGIVRLRQEPIPKAVVEKQDGKVIPFPGDRKSPGDATPGMRHAPNPV